MNLPIRGVPHRSVHFLIFQCVHFFLVTHHIFKNEIEYMRSKLTIHCRKKFGIPKYEADILIYNKFFHMPYWTEIRRLVFRKNSYSALVMQHDLLTTLCIGQHYGIVTENLFLIQPDSFLQ